MLFLNNRHPSTCVDDATARDWTGPRYRKTAAYKNIAFMIYARVEFPIQLVGRLPHRLRFFHTNFMTCHTTFSIDFEIFRFRNDHVDPKLCHDIRY